MIQESVLCLDRRVVDPPAVEAGGSTTWTLPYPVEIDGSEGTVKAVLLDTGTEVILTRPSPDTAQAVGLYAGQSVAVGIAYEWRYVPSTIYMRGPDGKPDLRTKVRLGTVRAMLSGTRHMQSTVTVPGRFSYSQEYTDAAPPDAGQEIAISVCADSKLASLELSSDSPWPVRIAMMEWDGQFDPNTKTQAIQ